MSGIIFGLFSLAFILFASTIYHIKEANKGFLPQKKLKRRAGQLGLISALSLAAAFLLSYK